MTFLCVNYHVHRILKCHVLRAHRIKILLNEYEMDMSDWTNRKYVSEKHQTVSYPTPKIRALGKVTFFCYISSCPYNIKLSCLMGTENTNLVERI